MLILGLDSAVAATDLWCVVATVNIFFSPRSSKTAAAIAAPSSGSVLAPISSKIKMLEEIELKPYQVKRLELDLFTFALRRFQLSIQMTEEKRYTRAGGGSPGRPP